MALGRGCRGEPCSLFDSSLSFHLAGTGAETAHSRAPPDGSLVGGGGNKPFRARPDCSLGEVMGGEEGGR
eukprot:752821-Hanusia_phi.AAC.4